LLVSLAQQELNLRLRESHSMAAKPQIYQSPLIFFPDRIAGKLAVAHMASWSERISGGFTAKKGLL